MSIGSARGIEKLEQLKAEAADPRALYHAGEAARASWRQRVSAVLTNALGEDAEVAVNFRDIRYGLMMVTSSTPDSAWESAFVSGTQKAVGLIEAAIFELELRRESETARAAIPAPASRQTHVDAVRDRRAVFVVHGRNELARIAMFDFLRSLRLMPIEWSEAVHATGRPSPYVGDILEAAFRRAQAVLVLMTPDDEARLRPDLLEPSDPSHERTLTPQARANVLFEAGMAMAWDEDRTVLVELGRCRPFSDIGGRHVLRIDDSPQRRQELGQRLQNAGLDVNMDGTDWHSAGAFDAALHSEHAT